MGVTATTSSPTAPGAAGRLDAREAEIARLRAVVLGALVVMLPMASTRIVWSDQGGEDNLNRAVTASPFDLALVGVLVLWVLTGQARERIRRPTSLLGTLTCALGALTLVAFAANPSPRGVEWVVRVLGCIAIVDTWRSVPTSHRRALLGVVVGVGAAQSVLAMLQSARGEAFGVEYLDYGWKLYQFGSSHAGRGGLTHPYHLAVFLVVVLAAGIVGVRSTRRPLPWLTGLAVCGAGLGVTYSRASLLALASATILVLYTARRVRQRVLVHAVAVAAMGFAFSVALFGDGWYARYEQSTGDGADSGRIELWSDAIDMTADHPVLGVGPARYTIALSDHAPDAQLLPAHNVVLHYAAELGVLGGFLVGALGCVATVALARRGAMALVPLVVLLPYFLLDAYPYIFATGLAVTAIAAAIALDAADSELT